MDLWVYLRVFLFGLAVVIIGVGDGVSSFFLGQLMPTYASTLLISSPIFYMPFLLVLLLIDRYRRRDTKEDPFDAPKIKGVKLHAYFFLIGALGVLGDIPGYYANPFVNANLQSILGQLYIPITIILVKLIGVEKFSPLKVMGGMVVFTAVMIGVSPPFIKDIRNGHYSDKLDMNPYWIIAVASAAIPNSLYNVYQEILFHRYRVRFTELIFWVNVYGTILDYAAIPIAVIPQLQTHTNFSQLLSLQWNGIKCVFGALSDDPGCSPDSWKVNLLWNIFVCLYCVSEPLVIAKQSATFSSIVETLFAPVTAIYFALPFLVGHYVEPLTWYIIVSLALIFVGMTMYKGKEIFSKETHSPYGYTNIQDDDSMDTALTN